MNIYKSFLFFLVTVTVFLTACESKKKELLKEESDLPQSIAGLEIPFRKTTLFSFSITDSPQIVEPLNFYKANKRILNLAIKGKIPVYPNDSLNKKISGKNLNTKIGFVGIDTGAKTFSKPFTGEIKVKVGYTYDQENNYGMPVPLAYAFVYQKEIEGILLGGNALYWVKLSELNYDDNPVIFDYINYHLLNKLHYSGLPKLKTTLGKTEDDAKLITSREVNFTGAEDPFLPENKFWELNRLIFKKIFEDKVDLYKTPDLKEKFGEEEARKRGSSEELVKIYPDINDPEYYYDSIIINYHHAGETVKYFVLESWEIEDGILDENELKAVAPVFTPIVENIQLPEEPLYWIKIKDLEKILSPEDFSWFKKFLYLTMQKQLSYNGN